MSLASLFRKVKKAAKSPKGKAVIAVASVVLPIAAPKAVAKGVRVYKKAKAVKDLVG